MIRPGIRRLFHLALGRRADTRRDVNDEIELHLALRVERLVGGGMTPDAARREALRLFGSTRDASDAMRNAANERDSDLRLSDRLEAFSYDVRHALRGLIREPGFTVFVVLTLALGIGANAAMFGVVDRLLVRGPDHVRDSDELVRLYTRGRTRTGETRTSQSAGYVRYLDMRERTRSFASLAAYASFESTIGRGAQARPARVGWVTADFFGTVGVRPARGRFFTAEEDAPLAPRRVAVIGYGLWKSLYAGDAIAGKTIVLEDETYEIIGVAPRGFTGVELARVDVWAPMSIRGANAHSDWQRTRNAQWLSVIGRLKPGISADVAGEDATAAHRAALPTSQATIVPLPISFTSGGLEPPEARIARWLLGVAAIVLLIACANTVNMLLARAVRRRREVAVRVALGSGRGRLIRMLLTEGVALAIAGGVAGLAVAYAAGSLVRRTLLPNIEWTSSPIGWRVLIASGLVALLTGILVGLVPALQASRGNLALSLKAGVREGGGRRATTRSVLTVAQAALSVMLLVGAGLFVRSLMTIRDIELGLDPERIIVAWVPAPDSPNPAEDFTDRIARQRIFHKEVLDSVRRLPEVERASLAVGLSFGTAFGVGLRVPGLDSIPSLPGGGPFIHAVTSNYFETVGSRIIRGRAFTNADRDGSERVVIVSELMANTLWPGRDAIGQCLMIGDEQPAPCAQVVGIAANAARFSFRDEPAMEYFVPFGQERGIGGTNLVVRPRGRPAAAYQPIEKVVRVLFPSAGYIRMSTMQQALDPQLRPWRLGATMFSVCGLLALAVAAIGLYSVMQYVVAQRTHEFAVRSALGARPADLVRLIVSGGVGLAVLGVVMGLIPAWFAARWMEPLLFETDARDPSVYGAVAATLVAVAIAACITPAMRANRITPVSALKAE